MGLKKISNRLKIINRIVGARNKFLIVMYFLSKKLFPKSAKKILYKDIKCRLDNKTYILINKNQETDLWLASPLYDKKIFDNLKNLKFKTFIDVGANKGLYSLKLARQSKNILAIEPQSDNFNALLKNIKINKIKNIIPKKIGCFDKHGIINLSLNEHSGTPSLIFKRSNKFEKIEIDKLDNIVKKLKIKDIDFIKIDVEGAELQVIQGAKNILKKYKPKILFEALDTESLEKIKKFLGTFKYETKLMDGSNYLAK